MGTPRFRWADVVFLALLFLAMPAMMLIGAPKETIKLIQPSPQQTPR
jgi:hypothetical protein